MERSNTGEELVNTSLINSSILLDLDKEFILSQWNSEQQVEQTIGVPFLSEIPILKYLFSTTTTSSETSHFYLTVTPRLLNTSRPDNIKTGELLTMEK